jgi:hypothetical protein
MPQNALKYWNPESGPEIDHEDAEQRKTPDDVDISIALAGRRRMQVRGTVHWVIRQA